MKIFKFTFKTFILIIAFFSTLLIISNADISSTDRVILQTGQVPNLSIQSTLTLTQTWPVIDYLPPYYKNPAYVGNGQIYQPELSNTRLDGIEQKLLNPSINEVYTVDYGLYDSSKAAQDALFFIAYENGVRANYGDLAFWVSYPSSGDWGSVPAGALYFTKGPYIFMVDTVNNRYYTNLIVNALLQNYNL